MIDERSYNEILAEAKNKFPHSSLLSKCRKFYVKNEYLTEGQINALDKLPKIEQNDSVKVFLTEEEFKEDLVKSGAVAQDEVDAGLVDDLWEEIDSEYFETWKDAN